jgi:uncharacterized membrane protein YccC
MDEEVMALLIPMVLFVCLLGAVAVTLYFRAARERDRHETLRRMVDKGMEIPSALLVPPSRPASDLRRGLILVGAGLGLIVMMLTMGQPDARRLWAVGLIPTLMGGAYLLTWRIRLKEAGSQTGGPRDAGAPDQSIA